MRSNRLLFQLVPSERHTEETGFGLLPTVTAIDSGGGIINKSLSKNAKERPTIALAAKMGLLPTPSASEGEKYTTKLNPNSQMGMGLTAMGMNGLLPTPKARDWKGMEGRSYKGKTKDLPTVANILNNTGQTSQLNPQYVAEMMGFPIDWTELPFLNGEQNQ